jgi:pimeloyl-ACP methyl ester carboxylesterase
VQSFDAGWEIEPVERFYLRLASFSRLILFDKRGTGLSDRVAPDDLPTLETRMDDMRAVMDAVGAVLGHSEGGSMRDGPCAPRAFVAQAWNGMR